MTFSPIFLPIAMANWPRDRIRIAYGPDDRVIPSHLLGWPLLTGRLRNRSALILTDVSIKMSFYVGQSRVGEAWVGGAADRLQGKTTGEKGISDMKVLPGMEREFAVRFEAPVPVLYTRVEFQVVDPWGTPLDREGRVIPVPSDQVELVDLSVHPQAPHDSPAGTPERVPVRP